MKISNAVVLAFVVRSVQLRRPTPRGNAGIRISDYFANYTSPSSGLDTAKDVTVITGGLPPPVPPRPDPKPPGEPYLSLFASASNDVWEKAKCKGANFVRAMRGSDREAGSVFKPARESAAAEFESLEDMEKWGWDIHLDQHVGEFDKWGVDHIFRDLDISDKCTDEGGLIHCLTFVHGYAYLDDDGNWVSIDQQTYKADGRVYRKTGAHYGLGFEPNRGVIIAMDRDSPQSAGKDRKPVVEGDELPAVRACSDIAWLSWKQFGAELGDVKNLNYFLSLSITNTETQAIMSRAIRDAVPGAQSFPAWGGYEFDTDTPEGQAILGTPNAQAFSYFLLQHKATLGNLYISQARVFRDSRRRPGPNLLLVVEPVPADADVDKPDDQHDIKGAGGIRRHMRRLKLRISERFRSVSA